jgi:hypothetical protein
MTGVGHVFQGHYKAILVQKEAYLLELARDVRFTRCEPAEFVPSASGHGAVTGR